MIAAYAILGANSGNLGVAALIGLIVVPVLAVGIPVYWTTKVDRQPISTLGITWRRWLPSLVLSILLSLLIVYPLFFSNRAIVSMDQWLPMAAAGALSLFEPLFVFGWLQLRFEKDFGVLPGLLLAALGFAFYHIGYMPEALAGQFFAAVVFAVCFRLTSNLLVAWPLLWATSSAWLCIGDNICFYNWGMVSSTAIALLIELAFITFMALHQRRMVARSVHVPV
jgi:membrane protease YdiL (CAAX protease family)